MSTQTAIDFEHYPPGAPMDETDVSLRAYIAGLPEERLSQYDPSWADDQVMAWDGNFRNDGALMLVCCERDVSYARHGKRLSVVERLELRQFFVMLFD